jgi:hypothetical protein
LSILFFFFSKEPAFGFISLILDMFFFCLYFINFGTVFFIFLFLSFILFCILVVLVFVGVWGVALGHLFEIFLYF